jgi:hypothetical protein
VVDDEHWHSHVACHTSVKYNSTKGEPPAKKPNQNAYNYEPAQGSKPLTKLSDELGKKPRKKKQTKQSDSLSLNALISSPIAMSWDSSSYSCAYDSLFTVLYSVWQNDPSSEYLSNASKNVYWNMLHTSFNEVKSGDISLNRARDRTRQLLNNKDRRKFPSGQRYASLDDLSEYMFELTCQVNTVNLLCRRCNIDHMTQVEKLLFIQLNPSVWLNGSELAQLDGEPSDRSVNDWIKVYLNQNSSRRCWQCHTQLTKTRVFHKAPDFLAIQVHHTPLIKIENKMMIPDNSGTTHQLKLSGIIYHDELAMHYTSRFVGPDMKVWFHDGILTGNSCIDQGHISSFNTAKLREIGNKKASLLLYTKI